MGSTKTIILILSLVTLAESQGPVKKQVISPVVKSLILPGWGENTLGNLHRARIFSLLETGLWIGIAGTYLAAAYEEDNFHSYAAEYAGVDVSGKNHAFWVDIGNYLSRQDYNEEHLRFRDNNELYPRTSEWDWVWDSENNRLQDGVSSYGFGVTIRLGGISLNWDFAKQWDFDQSLDSSTTFWIGSRF